VSLLAPLFLLSGLAVALPLWLHRLNVQSAERRPFGSAMLLESTERQVHVQKKLRYRLLLALRTAMLLLVALAFAKPVWTDPTPAADRPPATHLLVIDASPSMGRDGLPELARRQARAVLEAIPEGAAAQVLAADARVRVLSELAAAQSGHRAAIDALEPGPLRLEYGAMMAAVDRLAGDLPQPVELHLVSDFQQSGMPGRFADLVGGRIAALSLYPVAHPGDLNRRVESAAHNGSDVEVGVFASDAVSGEASLALAVNDAPPARVAIAGAGRSSRTFEGLELEAGDNRIVAALAGDDDLAIDDTFYYVIDNAPPEPVALITMDPDGRAATYLVAALQADAGSGYRVEFLRPGESDFRTLARYGWAIVDDVGVLGGGLDAVLGAFVEDGGRLLAFAGERAGRLEALPVSGHPLRPTAAGAADGRFLGIGQIDAGHPLLADTPGWHAVNVSRSLVIEPGAAAQVLARLDDGTPFLVESGIGAGRMLLVTSALDNEWNDLPTRPVFVSFMVEAARYLSGAERLPRAFTAGDTLPLALTGGVSGQVIDPDGRTLLSLEDTTRAQQIRLEQPGFYEVYTPRGDFVVAVNTDPRESESATVAPAELERWQAAIAGQPPAAAAADRSAADATIELWHAVLLLLAVLVVGESLLGDASFRPRAIT
jgi:hypothetical protein